MNAFYSRPLLKAKALAISLNKNGHSAIDNLLLNRRPTAVRRPAVFSALIAMSATVVAVIILAVDRHVIRWPISHVFKKRYERLAPSTTYDNTIIEIRRFVFASRWTTSLQHAIPNVIFRRVCQSMRSPSVSLKASTAFGMSTLKLWRSNKHFLSTRTNTSPTSRLALRAAMNAFDYCQAIKRLSAKINQPTGPWLFLRCRLLFSVNTATASRVSAPQMICGNDRCLTAITLTEPSGRSGSTPSNALKTLNGSQATKLLSGQVFELMSIAGTLSPRHEQSPLKIVCVQGRTSVAALCDPLFLYALAA